MSDFRKAFRAREPLFASFFRTPSHALAEVMSRAPVDAVCIDTEHAPLDRADVDALLLAFRAGSMPTLVRVSGNSPNAILQALDGGADGVVVPHVETGEAAEAVANAAAYRTSSRAGGRGYAGATRAGGYGERSMSENIALADPITVGQIESATAVANAADICAARLDCIFIGRSDLTVSLGGTDPKAPEVVEAVEHVARTASDAGKAVGTFTSDLAELPRLRKLGITFFLLGSEHGFILRGARDFADQVREHL